MFGISRTWLVNRKIDGKLAFEVVCLNKPSYHEQYDVILKNEAPQFYGALSGNSRQRRKIARSFKARYKTLCFYD